LLIADPDNGGGATVAYDVSYNQPLAGVDTWSPYSSYTAGDPVPSDATGVRVEASVTVGGTTYMDTPGYADATCTAQ
jgi:hypothetical protein